MNYTHDRNSNPVPLLAKIPSPRTGFPNSLELSAARLGITCLYRNEIIMRCYILAMRPRTNPKIPDLKPSNKTK